MAFNFGPPAASKPTLSFAGNATANNPNPAASLFTGLGPRQPESSNTQTTTTAAAGGSLFGPKPATTQQSNMFGQTLTANANANQQPTATPGTSTLSSGAPQIDLAHLRSTTKYDHLTPQLQHDIMALDTAILNQIRQCSDVTNLLPAVTSAGKQLAPAIDYVSTKLDELETGLENDAEAVVHLRDDLVRKDEGEAKCVFRTVDRLKLPRQYQVGNAAGDVGNIAGAGYGVGFNGGLSGWWNQPQAYRGSSMRATGTGLSVQLVDEDLDDDKSAGPKNLAALFNTRAAEMDGTGRHHRRLLAEIETFVAGLEEKVYIKERDLNERLDNGVLGDAEGGLAQERDHQMQLLRFVFGEVQRNLYEVAEKVGEARDGVVDLGVRDRF